MPRASEMENMVYGQTSGTFGEWGIVRSIFEGLAFRIAAAGEVAAKVLAEDVATRIRDGIRTGKYTGMHAPLAESTIARKDRQHAPYPERTWYEWGDLVDVIEAFHTGRGVYVVGVKPDAEDDRGQPLAVIADALEWGTHTKKRGGQIPARPVFRTEANRISADGESLGRLRVAFKLAMSIGGYWE